MNTKNTVPAARQMAAAGWSPGQDAGWWRKICRDPECRLPLHEHRLFDSRPVVHHRRVLDPAKNELGQWQDRYRSWREAGGRTR